MSDKNILEDSLFFIYKIVFFDKNILLTISTFLQIM
jgi:hypothetical protein